MNPQPICAGCEAPTTIFKPVCDACLLAAGVRPTTCIFCLHGRLARDAQGNHITDTGGYAGRCADA